MVYEEKTRLLKENRELFLRLLKENNAAKFRELLKEHPNYVQVSF